MPLYEIVLRYPDRDEVRITDQDPQDTGYVTINGSRWPIIAHEPADTPRIERRYIVRAVAPTVS
jgi:hypothetical protein